MSPGVPAPEGSQHRRDIQGLRALAVVAVVGDHLLGWPAGGFVGVDVFFVLSGFLITDLLLRERAATGRISLRGFYERRARRLLPAAWLVLAVTLLGSWLIYSGPRLAATVADAGWAVAFAANWRFGLEGTDYFRADAPPSPLQHYWSLAVEEQYYVVWPVLLVALAALASRAGTRGAQRVVVGATAALVALASFVWAVHESAVAPTVAYFSTFSRAWELAVGAGLAAGVPVLRRIRPVPARVLSWVGLTGIVASMLLVGSDLAFPGPWAAAPVAATALVVLAGVPEHADGPWLLRNRVATWLGDRSYSLYLWHFPVIVLGFAVVAETTVTRAGAALAMLVAAYYSYELVETPLRRSRRRTSGRPATSGVLTPRYRLLVASLGAVVVTALLAGLALRPTVASPGVDLTGAAPAATTIVPPTGAEARWQEKVLAALETADWPVLDPSMEQAIGSAQAPSDVVACGVSTETVDLEACTWGPPDARRTAVVVGDSVSLTYVAPLRGVLEARGSWDLVSLGTFGCPFVPLPVGSSSEAVDDCATRRAEALATIADLDPDVVVVANSSETPDVLGTGDSVSDTGWARGVEQLLAPAVATGAAVVVLAPPPGGTDIEECYTRLSSPVDCVGQVSDSWVSRARSEQTMATELGGTWISSAPWFCFRDQCPSFVDGVPVRSDAVHMTTAFAERVEPLLASALRSTAALTGGASEAGGPLVRGPEGAGSRPGSPTDRPGAGLRSSTPGR
ncbi:hypothetical protein ASF47_08015 [Nocardioides sp. Leaf285]|nr:hypothetical protein ASF47_08015 [Nocardioides sp. Leaf285]